MTTDEAIEAFQTIGVPISRVNPMAEVVTDPLVANQLVHVSDPRSDLTVALPAPPVGEAPSLRFPPRLGEHNQEIYGQALGYTTETLANLREEGII
jgi:formyl-CoA transferase